MYDDNLDLSLSVSWDDLLEEKAMAEVIKEKCPPPQGKSQPQPVDAKEYIFQFHSH